MRYIMKAGILYNDDALAVLARVKSSLVGPLKKIDDNKGQLLLEADIRCLDQIKSSSGDVRNREYVLIDPEGKVIYTELVPEITQEPNYEAALKAVK